VPIPPTKPPSSIAPPENTKSTPTTSTKPSTAENVRDSASSSLPAQPEPSNPSNSSLSKRSTAPSVSPPLAKRHRASRSTERTPSKASTAKNQVVIHKVSESEETDVSDMEEAVVYDAHLSPEER
jgi:hypothetical protein